MAIYSLIIPQNTSSLRALQRNAWQSTTKNIGGNPQCNIEAIDCHDSTLCAESRNDKKNRLPRKS
ncbi:hypothetical protein [Helicobacter sp. T3_23-1056]